MDILKAKLNELWNIISHWAVSPPFYAQIGAIIAAVIIAWVVTFILKNKSPLLSKEPLQENNFYGFRLFFYRIGDLIFSLLIILLLSIASDIAKQVVGQSWMIKIALSLAVVFLLYTFISRFIDNITINLISKWIGIPIAILYVLGWLDNVIDYLDTISIDLGNIDLTLYGVIRTILFGAILFWLGRISNNIGTRAIRQRENLDASTREVLAKLFEISVIIVFFILLLQIMGINLTALAVFGGALGVGLGFGLQQIASNFISGIIILLDRSITIGDYIEMDDGRSGTLRELNMRHAILETFDGKDVMVPNEQFITTSYINWTHKNTKQRYSLEFSVAYKTDLDMMFPIIRDIVASHPKVLSGPDLPVEERPDAEILDFGESGINILVEFWIEGIDDGVNRVGADLLHMIWKELRKNNIEIPFPQREVKILNN
ncbi:MAG: mechanosensitive ion channel [Gammaproteobacteria bacterium]|nr:mechanosensitive ion channel [Gammaproteobacteria bacterium]NIN62025.1 mechanosensitive ion channel [Gammaproteobacteria bacterium]NIO62104.1 mechanosensitive ion channel [Gammaproteobacteria bacterium]NIQ08286.1 mechanosensitive ion channel [Gammaproteobacteria bacterium]NIQ19816.1 mechanosensitive ion channel [Gammaproteobacteria bacterium]